MDHSRIVADLGGYAAVARELRVLPKVAWRWGQSRCIPVGRWRGVVRMAQARGLAHITLDALLSGYAPAKPRRAHNAGVPRTRKGGAAQAAA